MRPSRLDRAVDAALAACGAREAAGAAVIADAEAAFAVRAASARAAGRSLDLQYYIWRGDLTGMLLAREVLAAADRGVVVRLLLDDAYAIGHERTLAALDAHPAVEVRLFNATRWRRFGRFGHMLEILFGGWHLTRRMHNKAWIADGRFAVLGGRNVGDAYFGLTGEEGVTFRDLDLALAGPPAAQAMTLFERYWTSGLARPASEICAVAPREGLDGLRADLEAAAGRGAALGRLLDAHPAAHIRRGLRPVPPDAIRVIADSPEKARRGLGARKRARAAGGIAADIADALRQAKREVRLISPYFVPGEAGLALLAGLVARGVAVSVVTNALAATDVVAVHGGYMRYRRALLRAGVVLHELKPDAEEEKASLFGSRGGASLHTKALAVDGELAFIGSFNLDPRSAMLNTEMGAFIRDAVVAAAVAAEQARLMQPARSWRLELRRGRLAWVDAAAGRPRRRHAEPEASWGRTIVAWIARLLPIEQQL
jgi:putative cardiolipin synthase